MRGLPGGTGRLMIMDADGGNATQLGDVVAGALQIAWSPDDSSLVYSDVRRGLWTIGADGMGAKRIFADVGEASWSTDGPTWIFTDTVAVPAAALEAASVPVRVRAAE